MAANFGFDRVSKQYQIGSAQASLRELLARIPRRLANRRGRVAGESIWAVKDVSLEAAAGDVVGLIGHNGAGKTTLLKLLSNVTQPTSGRVRVEGRVSSLIELGAGFHPDLTGRENIYLNGVILGLSRREIDRKFQTIVDFAELEKFIETPVKRYSSGMYARLGFAVAAHTEPDLLLVDEVLGVGDQAFQQKCFDFIQSFVAGSKTALFVSHNLYVMEQLCNTLVWLDHGRVAMAGAPREVLPRYFDYMEERALRGPATDSVLGEGLSLVEVTFTDEQGRDVEGFGYGETVVVNIHYQTSMDIERPHFYLGVTGAAGGQLLFNASMLVDGCAPAVLHGRGVVKCQFEAPPLMPGVFQLWGEIWSGDRSRTLVDWQRLGSFRVVDTTATRLDDAGEGSIRHSRADAPIRVSHRWVY